MFKKPIKVGAQNQLSGKDRKTIRNKLATLFDADAIDALLKSDKIICNKVAGSKMLIYVGEDYPLIVDGTGKDDFFPSVYTCTAYETLAKSLSINEGVEGYIFNGANLMWPGVRDLATLQNFKKDQVVAIRNSKDQVVAVGAMGCSFEDLKKNTDGSGIAVYILHFKGDRLWDMGSKQYPEVIIKRKEEAKIQEAVKQEEPKIEEKKQKIEEEIEPKGKDKKKEPQPKKQPETKKESEPESESDGDFDFGAIVHTKNAKPQAKIEKKKAQKFFDEQDDKKGKKKGGKKGGPKKMEESDSEEEHKKPVKPKGKGKKEESDSEEEHKKPVKPKGKGKKEESDSEEEHKKPVKPKGKGKKEESDSEEEHKKPVKPKGKGKKEESDSEEEHKKPVKPKGKGKGKKEQSDSEEDEKKDKQITKKKGKTIKQKQEKNSENSEDEKEKKMQESDEEKPEKSTINSHLMDQYFKQAFLNVLKLSKIEGELPVDSGRFFSDYMVFARTDETKLQIKDSTFKKLGRFYEEMAKQKFIEFKPAKQKKGQQGSTITKILWENEDLKNYVPTIKRMGEKEVQGKEEVFSKEKLQLSKTVVVDYAYKLTEELKKVLLVKKKVNYMPDNSDQEVHETKEEVFLSEKDLRESIEKYLNEIAVKEKEDKKEQKEAKGKDRKVEKLVTLSYKDNEFIHRVLKKEIEEFEENLAHKEIMEGNDSDEEEEGKKKGKKDKQRKNLFKIERGYIVNKIVKLAMPCYNISDKDSGLNKFKEGAFKGVQVIADKIMNKNVTKIIGLETFIPAGTKEEEVVKQIHGFAHELQLKFASSSTVQNLPGKNAGKEVVVQGNFADELEALLTGEYGLRKDYVSIQNKLDKKKKK